MSTIPDAIPEFCNAAGPGVSLLDEARDLVAHENLLRSLVMRDLTVRYKRSVIGVFWTMLNPLLTMLVLTDPGLLSDGHRAREIPLVAQA